MPERKSSIAVFILIIAVLCPSISRDAIADQGQDTIHVVIPSEYPLSGAVSGIISTGHNISVTGPVQVISNGESSILFIPAATENGTKLISLYDSGSGLLFRNNTMALPIGDNSKHVANLVLATENLTATAQGYSGSITGYEIDVTGLNVRQDGRNFTAGLKLFLKSLPVGASYRCSMENPEDAKGMIDESLASSGLSALDVPMAIGVTGENQQSGDSIGFIIASFMVESDWAGKYGDDNISVYECKNGLASGHRCKILTSGEDGIVYQAVMPDTATVALAATGERVDRGLYINTGNIIDIAIFGGLLVVLVSALAIMVRRMFKG
ncbi:MAG TPA: hypothetical protein VK436_07505 [Methanocella sp.]|nr:hypothetical protein [Methanocella sp.]